MGFTPQKYEQIVNNVITTVSQRKIWVILDLVPSFVPSMQAGRKISSEVPNASFSKNGGWNPTLRHVTWKKGEIDLVHLHKRWFWPPLKRRDLSHAKMLDWRNIGVHWQEFGFQTIESAKTSKNCCFLSTIGIEAFNRQHPTAIQSDAHSSAGVCQNWIFPNVGTQASWMILHQYPDHVVALCCFLGCENQPSAFFSSFATESSWWHRHLQFPMSDGGCLQVWQALFGSSAKRSLELDSCWPCPEGADRISCHLVCLDMEHPPSSLTAPWMNRFEEHQLWPYIWSGIFWYLPTCQVRASRF